MFEDRVKETTNSTGTGNLTLAGAETGHRSFNTAFGVGPSFNYVILSGTDWEVGVGHLSASTTFVRDKVERSTNSNNAISVASGATIFCDFGGTAVRVAYSESAIGAVHSLR